jgi:hypothetical protein
VATGEGPGDLHLRSAREVHGYDIQGTDGSIGHVDDLIVDDEDWAVRYLIVNTSNWWVGKRVAIAPQWAERISWPERKVNVALSRQAITDSPLWPGPAAANRQYEALLYQHHGRPTYWMVRDHPELALDSLPAPRPPT